MEAPGPAYPMGCMGGSILSKRSAEREKYALPGGARAEHLARLSRVCDTGKMTSRVAISLALAACLGGCVSKATYDQALVSAAQTKEEADRQASAAKSETDRLRAALDKLEAQAQDRDTELSDMATRQHNTEAELEQASALNEQLRGELDRLSRAAEAALRANAPPKDADDAPPAPPAQAVADQP